MISEIAGSNSRVTAIEVKLEVGDLDQIAALRPEGKAWGARAERRVLVDGGLKVANVADGPGAILETEGEMDAAQVGLAARAEDDIDAAGGRVATKEETGGKPGPFLLVQEAWDTETDDA